MDYMNSARSATLDALLPQLAEGPLRQRREVAVLRPSTHGTRHGTDGFALYEGLLGQTASLAGDLVQIRTPHRVLETLEHQRLCPVPYPFIYLARSEERRGGKE